ncbi:DMT family transporter [Comamonas terrae]|uniref:DMT family transporter n=1 Tax=Comamonas terrae TaxID=673548 RepID=A0ABW5UIJ2_9BURK|nr:DMT family transporter [Comamonas terrae]
MHSPLPVFALLFNAFIWGLSWWPFRAMHGAGLHPLWATALMYCLLLGGLLALRPSSLRQALQYPVLLLLAASSGLNNVAFNWAVTVGDVVRVILLFYLMPAWAILLAWAILGERPTPMALLRLVLAFGGVLLVLLPADASPAGLVQGLSLADALAVFGGFMFALTNVLLRRLHAIPGQARMLVMFAGCMAMGLATALTAHGAGLVPAFPAVRLDWLGIALALAVLLMLGNWALQFGAAHLPSSVTSVVMLSEVAFASVSSVLIAHETLSARTLLGGACIMAAALLAALGRRRQA